MIFLLINYFIDNQIEFIKITKFDFSYLFLIFISYSLSMFFSSSKDLFILRNLINKNILSLFNYFKIFSTARLLTKFFPQSGNVYNAVKLKKKYKIGYLYTVITFITNIIINNYFNIIILLIIIGMFFNDFVIGEYLLRDLLGYIFIFFSLIIFIFYLFLKKISYIIKIDYKKFYNSIFLLFKNYILLIKLFSVNILSLIFTSITKYIILFALDINISFVLLLILVVVDSLLILINLTPGNIGIKEFVYAYIFEISYLNYTDGMILVIVYRLVAISSLVILFMLGKLKKENPLFLIKII